MGHRCPWGPLVSRGTRNPMTCWDRFFLKSHVSVRLLGRRSRWTRSLRGAGAPRIVPLTKARRALDGSRWADEKSATRLAGASQAYSRPAGSSGGPGKPNPTPRKPGIPRACPIAPWRAKWYAHNRWCQQNTPRGFEPRGVVVSTIASYVEWSTTACILFRDRKRLPRVRPLPASSTCSWPCLCRSSDPASLDRRRSPI